MYILLSILGGTTNRSEWKASIQFAKGNINTPPMLTELGFDKDTKTIPIHSGFKSKCTALLLFT